ncbi:MAG: transcriptional repressor [Candidatus Saccharimonadales bacterium]
MPTVQTITPRQTRYATAIAQALAKRGHATNAELHTDIRNEFPEVSSTTVHRVTGRLKDRGIIGAAPATASGAERFDTISTPHHHFMCSACGNICDIPQTDESKQVMRQLKELSGQCAIAGTLTMLGTCHGCAAKREEL